MKLVLVNELLPDKDFQAFLRATNYWVPICESRWGKMFDSIEGQTFLDPTKPYVLKSDETPIFLTERNWVKGIAGKHRVELLADGNKIPTAYISLKESKFVYGKFHYPLIVKAHKVGTLTIPQRQFGAFSILSQGLVSAMLHEIFEIVGNPYLDRHSGSFQNTTLDSQGRSWFMEDADHNRTLHRWTDPVTGQDCAIPNFVHLAFYTLGSLGQLDEFHAVSSPFTLGRDGYAYEVKPDGTKIKIA